MSTAELYADLEEYILAENYLSKLEKKISK